MPAVIELKCKESPLAGERHALVIASSIPPVECVPVLDRGLNRTFFASLSEHDIAIIVRRARTWAKAACIAKVYVRREG